MTTEQVPLTNESQTASNRELNSILLASEPSAITGLPDLSKIIQASQRISSQMELAPLLNCLLETMMESAGASYGILFLKENTHWKAAIEGTAGQSQIRMTKEITEKARQITQSALLPWVLQTQANFISANSSLDVRQEKDTFDWHMAKATVLAVPILHHQQTEAILYLERPLEAQAFSEDTVAIIQLLCTQAAIALENARLYEAMKADMAERKRAEAILRTITEGTSTVVGIDFFHSLVKHLAAALHVHMVLITECMDAQKTRVRTLAFFKNNTIADNIEYTLAGTPCEYVIAGKEYMQVNNVDIDFPREAGSKSFLGVPLLDSTQTVTGHLAVYDNKPNSWQPYDISILRIFAARASIELERIRIEKAFRQAYDGLEINIKERTKELSQANEKLNLEVMERKEAQKALEFRVNMEELITSISARFLNVTAADIDHEITEALHTMATFMGVQRSYVCIYTPDVSQLTATHEWRQEAIPSVKNRLYRFDTAPITWMVNKLKNNEVVHIARNAPELEHAPAIRRFMEDFAIDSLLRVPVLYAGRLYAHLSFDFIHNTTLWQGKDLRLLRMMGETFVSSLERTRAEEALRQSERSLALTLDATKDGVFDFDISSGKAQISDNYYRMLGYEPNEYSMTVEKWASLIHPHDREAALQSLNRYIQDQSGNYAFDYRLVCKDGSYKWIHNRGKIVEYNPDGSARRMVGTNVDIHQRKMAEEAAEMASRAKSEFLANMSHELRTPLNGILGYTQILKKDSSITAQQRAGIDIIHQSGEHLLTLINDVLDLSKIEAHKLALQENDFNLSDCLTTVTNIARVKAEQKGLNFQYEPISLLPVLVHGDEVKLRQILLNLLGNATKFTEKGGISLKVGYHEKLDGQTWLRFQVEDTGIGIAPEDMQEIFLPFQQVGTTRRQVEGTGLGLTICQKFVELMGGELHVRSIPGTGSIFWVLLNLPQAETHFHEQNLQEPLIGGYTGNSKKILVVDDKKENRSVLTCLLEPLGFELQEANDGQEAFQKTIDWEPHLILMDLVMPVLDGFEATRKIRELNMPQPKIIALSASVFEHNQQLSLAAGCDDFLAKPLRADDLLEKIAKILSLEWTFSSSSLSSIQPAPPATSANTVKWPTLHGQIPPAETLTSLLMMANMGDVQAIVDELNVLENSMQYDPAFIATIRKMAKEFDMKKVRDFVRQHLGE